MKNLTDLEKGYLAGFIDGEGSLIINKREHVGYKGKRYITYSAYLDLGSTNREVLEYIKDLTKVTSKIYENPQKGNRKTAYRLRVSYFISKDLIEILKDNLIIKRKCAEVFLDYPTGKGNESKKEKLYLEMKKLNFRGIKKV